MLAAYSKAFNYNAVIFTLDVKTSNFLDSPQKKEPSILRTYLYTLAGNTFKKILFNDLSVELYKNDQKISVQEWNKAVNYHFPMKLKYESKNPLIKAPERARIRIISKYIKKYASNVVVDIGGGDGVFLNDMKKRAQKIICVDFDKELLDKVRKKFGSDNIDYLHSSVEKIDLPDKSCDFILASEILEHVRDLKSAIDELGRILEENGTIVLTVPHDKLVMAIKKVLINLGLRSFFKGLSDTLAMGHLYIFNKNTIEELFREKFIIKKNNLIPPFFFNRIVILQCKK